MPKTISKKLWTLIEIHGEQKVIQVIEAWEKHNAGKRKSYSTRQAKLRKIDA